MSRGVMSPLKSDRNDLSIAKYSVLNTRIVKQTSKLLELLNFFDPSYVALKWNAASDNRMRLRASVVVGQHDKE